MLMPKRTKWRKQQRGRIRGEACRGNEVAFGQFGLQSLEPGWVSARVIEAGRIACGRNAPEGKVLSRSPRSQPKLVRVRVRAMSISGRPSLSRAPSYSS